MPAERLPMRKVREVLRQRYACGASERVIAQSLGLGRTAVGEYIRRAAVIGITWPIPAELDDAALERKLFAPAGYNPPRSKPLPDWAHVHAELRRARVTLALLWQDYRGQHPDGYGYSRFCDLYGEWRRGVTATMRQTHTAGEKLFVDFAGDTMPVFDPVTGEVRDTKIFVAVLGASNYTYAEACLSERLPDWIGAHVNALEFLGGVPKAIVYDYVPGNIIGILCPRRLCVLPSPRGDVLSAVGHITGGGTKTGQHQDCGHQGVPVRAASQPDLYGDGSALRHWRAAREAAQAARQGQSRSRRADHGTLDSGTPAQSAVP